jgi:hypothetical protein
LEALGKSQTPIFETTSVMFVEQSKRGKLAAKLREVEQSLEGILVFHVKMEER